MLRRTIIALPFVVALGLASSIAADAQAPRPEDLDFFEKQVRPVLVERCYSCHAAQAKRVRGNLLLDTKAGWSKGGDSGPALVPGDPERSLLVEAVRYTDADLKMPPKGKLPAPEIDVLVEWVKRGAPDTRTGPNKAVQARVIDIAEGKKFWSFQPLKPTEPPRAGNDSWSRTAVDRFILARLAARGLQPSEEVGRRQLIRRAYFDLIGLPPTPEEVEAFISDRAPDAYDRLVDHLLASPHYGERWGRHWLDLARFAESHGFEHDSDRPTAFHYRDFVIEALNQDLPFDTFVRWQLAGDELAPDNLLALKATGFLAAGVHSTQITANQVEKERYDELDDMASTLGTSMLGLTIGCARCHDHKYDPIPQKDYYRLLATFTTTVRTELELDLDPKGYQEAKTAFEAEHAPYVKALAKFEAEELPARLEQWEKSRSQSSTLSTWMLLDPIQVKSKGGATLKPLPDGSFLAAGTNPDFDTYTFVAHLDEPGASAIRIEALADPSFVKGGPGRAPNGNFDLTDVRVTAAPADGSAPARAVALRNPRATFEQKGLPIAAAIDGNPGSGWAVDPQLGKSHAAVFELPADLGHQGGTVLTVVLDFHGNNKHNIGRPRISVSYAAQPVPLDGSMFSQRIAQSLGTPPVRRTPEQKSALLQWYRGIDPEWQKRSREVEAHAAKAPKPKTQKALISSEGLPALRLNTQGADFLEKTHFLKRGDPNQKQGEARQGFLEVLMDGSEQERHWQVDPPKGWRTSYRRTALANWITDPNQGAGNLLARVIVNRLWQHHLGRGIVSTPSDFGAQGDRPSHPELLDWLAAELIRNHWQLKPIHKLIMTSAVYRQGVRIDAAKVKIDPDNTLFWRQSRRRLEAEVIRDAMLAVGGVLDPTMFGPGTLDDNQRRRSIYFTVKRSKLVPMMLLFDAPDGLQGIAVRSSTTIAPQSLLLMNNPIVRSWAAGFANRLSVPANPSAEDAVRAGYLIALSRPPSAAELADAASFIRRQEELYQKAPNARQAKETALADFCQVLISLNEFVDIE